MSESVAGDLTTTISENEMRRVMREELARELEKTARRIRYPHHKFERVHASVPEAITESADDSFCSVRINGDLTGEALVEDLVDAHTGEQIDRYQALHATDDGQIVVIREKEDIQEEEGEADDR